ncbi:hypothetical protein A3D42_03180 [Candidatus Nomurabacteria bacterium RIFCSPHIGHO2_02_FULL_41_18]|uniref:HTH deoR-type domain-containing protein n=1 Tax=Candidatus Nomurabacteria bacterium RIFCSPHIGHO2_02_FULL_41_18 TaxID=1801754 RepID=A0A1F6W8D4_9BACT|nr:MAG: hypothetical protein A2737_01270 [Candidatus Nomurabacteria bacterium RIFCSPHIGHO2_01_FULL_41_71]OGI78036.1 MAG: hypothetical protein A3D42_03180 [Candidatus Nomurabacteria bacterium RIFCSPHIGHO2_02_FULL_41_18]OGI90091.1 MAG: hypothetical protein A3B01_03220 [Candidatus Nomurabacteria bacterium RIFCSPLOWO2_01_FULL_41_52b]
MFGEEKNLKDMEQNLSLGHSMSVKDMTFPIPYSKTNKLIIAMYMVTDIMERDEPIRNKLRTLGIDIISDIYFSPSGILSKISEIMSLLDIAGTVNMISQMNLNILRKEFFELKNAVEESVKISTPLYSKSEMGADLSELFRNDNFPETNRTVPTRIGVQKGSTLLKALSGVKYPKAMSDKNLMSDRTKNNIQFNFEKLREQRRADIITVIKEFKNGATITDIKIKAIGSLIDCGEKTLQRELSAMAGSGLLKRTGEKRWSRYFVSL